MITQSACQAQRNGRRQEADEKKEETPRGKEHQELFFTTLGMMNNDEKHLGQLETLIPKLDNSEDRQPGRAR